MDVSRTDFQQFRESLKQNESCLFLFDEELSDASIITTHFKGGGPDTPVNPLLGRVSVPASVAPIAFPSGRVSAPAANRNLISPPPLSSQRRVKSAFEPMVRKPPLTKGIAVKLGPFTRRDKQEILAFEAAALLQEHALGKVHEEELDPCFFPLSLEED